jgi:hypothetical protein
MAYFFLNLGARLRKVVNATHPLLYPQERDPAPTVQESGWVPGPVWTGAENFASTGIRSPDRPTRSESLYRLSHYSPRFTVSLYAKGRTKSALCLHKHHDMQTYGLEVDPHAVLTSEIDGISSQLHAPAAFTPACGQQYALDKRLDTHQS